MCLAEYLFNAHKACMGIIEALPYPLMATGQSVPPARVSHRPALSHSCIQTMFIQLRTSIPISQIYAHGWSYFTHIRSTILLNISKIWSDYVLAWRLRWTRYITLGLVPPCLVFHSTTSGWGPDLSHWAEVDHTRQNETTRQRSGSQGPITRYPCASRPPRCVTFLPLVERSPCVFFRTL